MPRLRARRPTAVLLGLAGVAVLAALLSACGQSQSQLAVSLKATAGATGKPGDSVDIVMTVENKGPGDAAGVRAELDLPAGYAYQATPVIRKDFLGTTRVQDTDPVKDARAPQWGAWSLSAPSTNADGTRRLAFVEIHATVRAAGAPGDYRLVPHAVSDSVGSDVTGQPVAVHLDPGPDLKVDLSVAPGQIGRDQDALYRVTIDNFGTGPSSGLSLLVVLPPGLNFIKTESIQGNSSQDQGSQPIPGALLVDYGGFTLPAAGPAGPGRLEITLRARCTFCTAGTFLSTAQVTDQDGTVVETRDGAQLVITGPASPPSPPPPPPTAAPPTSRPPGTAPPGNQNGGGNPQNQ